MSMQCPWTPSKKCANENMLEIERPDTARKLPDGLDGFPPCQLDTATENRATASNQGLLGFPGLALKYATAAFK